MSGREIDNCVEGSRRSHGGPSSAQGRTKKETTVLHQVRKSHPRIVRPTRSQVDRCTYSSHQTHLDTSSRPRREKGEKRKKRGVPEKDVNVRIRSERWWTYRTADGGL